MDSPFCCNSHLLSLLVQMYGLCIAIEDADAMFLQIQEKNVYSWNIIMGVNAKLGMWLMVGELCRRMQLECVPPDRYSLVSTLSAHTGLGNLFEGKALHAGFACTQLEEDVIVGTALINFYGHCGNTKSAAVMFEKVREPDLVALNALIAVHAQQGQGEAAFQLFEHMLQQGFVPNRVTFLAVVDACDTSVNFTTGKKFHTYVSCTEYESDAFVLTTFMSMYGKCDDVEMVGVLFDKMNERNVVSWNAVIAVHAHQYHRDNVLQLFLQMHEEDMIVGTALFSMYGRCSSLDTARKLFNQIVNRDLVAWNAMITLYAQNELGGDAVLDLIEQMQIAGVSPDNVTLASSLSACVGVSLEAAQRLFEKVRERNVLAWNAMLGACEQQGYIVYACSLFGQMLEEGATPDKVTYLILLSLCARMSAALEGYCAHTALTYCENESKGPLVSGLINMYSQCCCIDEFCWVFRGLLVRDDAVFNSFIAACADHGDVKGALQSWGQMLHEAVIPDEITCIGILEACATEGILSMGKCVHALIMKSEYVSDVSVATSLFNMYYKCSDLEEALFVFSSIVQHDVISWTAIISASAEQKQSETILQLFHQMQIEGVHADGGMYVNVLTACADEAALTKGKVFHTQILYNITKPDIILENALINLYNKCGCMKYAYSEFQKMSGRDVLTFNVVIAGLAQYGHGMQAFHLFHLMQRKNSIANEYTFSSMLSACSHAGLVEEGWACLIEFNYSWTPSIDHFDCMVDLCGRSGQLEEAECLLNEAPLQPTSVSYMTLLGAAKVQMDVSKGGLVSKYLFELDMEDASCYVALANLYASIERDAVVYVEAGNCNRNLQHWPRQGQYHCCI
ncbi:hypothetical protein L7F22_046860 [Adiantum nelumboides]|nr:hypothetical protein [Adiantum nelumboides]